jgi:hypothetical protein
VVSVGYVPKEFILSIEKNDFLRFELPASLFNKEELIFKVSKCYHFLVGTITKERKNTLAK